jgi:glycyl-tRNA synthetase
MDRFEKILDVAKRRGFFWQSALIHGGMAGFYDYGHIGTLVKRRFENLWRGYFIGLDDSFYEIETSTLMPENVFKSSGHLAHFVDPVVRCRKCGNVERADHILEDELKESFEGVKPEGLMKLIKKHKIKCGKCKGPLEDVGELNMMFPVDVGTGKEVKRAYLNPETAQGAYLNFKLEFEALRKKMPFGLAIIGKAFRNEISPRNALIRMREFSQAELQIFFDPEEIKEHPRFKEVERYKLRLLPVRNRKGNKIVEIPCKDAVKRLKLPKFYIYHLAKVQQFYLDVLKLPRRKFRFKELSDEEKAFYNKYHWDIEMELGSVGWIELAGVHYRTEHDLKGHQKVSGESMEVNVEGKKFIPNVLEISFGVDRNVFALLDISYDEEEERTVIRFPRLLSPFDAGIFPLVNRDGLTEKAAEVKAFLEGCGFNLFLDVSASIGRRYRRMDEIGVAAAVTIDYKTLKDGTVTLRDRDSMKQVRVSISELPEVLERFIDGEKLEKLGKVIN